MAWKGDIFHSHARKLARPARRPGRSGKLTRKLRHVLAAQSRCRAQSRSRRDRGAGGRAGSDEGRGEDDAGVRLRANQDSLEGWLLAVTRWKEGGQPREREQLTLTRPSATRSQPMGKGRGEGRGANANTARTATVECVPDPNGFVLEEIREAKWREDLLRATLDLVKQRANPAHSEMYQLQVVQGLSAKETARTLNSSSAKSTWRNIGGVAPKSDGEFGGAGRQWRLVSRPESRPRVSRRFRA